ncbi:uncharacterized protein EI90DRAFT_3085862 [Cantharellus anzutake]|uniref:uncharacterized protein n=1 Tax=Cantharellus anzutake TaxID=1750568 RepID=UPI001908B155|nr:uncharacterized protein EI90DRAFT_3085862 [Cantharellus anzutake]KAF8316917.1 hypothetical protein EI90DRAFT_3085862 [Cantharellus anzutake]
MNPNEMAKIEASGVEHGTCIGTRSHSNDNKHKARNRTHHCSSHGAHTHLTHTSQEPRI